MVLVIMVNSLFHTKCKVNISHLTFCNCYDTFILKKIVCIFLTSLLFGHINKKEVKFVKALVVGGTGPTGPPMVEGLQKRGYQVAILHRGTHEVNFPSPVEHLHGDPFSKESIEDTLGSRTFDIVISNYGRLRLIAQTMKGRTPRFIGIGGTGVYKDLVPKQRVPVGIPIPISENAALQLDPDLDRVTNLMVISEQEVMQIHNQGHYNATIFRYPHIYGPRQNAPKDWSIIRRIRDGRKYLVLPDGGLSLQPKGYSENVANAVMLGVDKPQESMGQIYNVRDEKVISLRERIELISQVMNHKWEEFIELPARLAKPAEPYCQMPYGPGSYHVLIDITKIRNELKYKDLFPIEEAIRKTVNWYLDNPLKPGGDEERRLGDPFDYEAEDKIIDEFKKVSDRIRAITFAGKSHNERGYQ